MSCYIYANINIEWHVPRGVHHALVCVLPAEPPLPQPRLEQEENGADHTEPTAMRARVGGGGLLLARTRAYALKREKKLQVVEV